MSEKKTTYVALLRGINVGGNNSIKMTELKACFESMGFGDVITYIQSGNVLFTTVEKKVEILTSTIERTLSKKFNYPSRVVVISHTQLNNIVTDAPSKFGIDTRTYRYDVIFLKPPLTPSEAIKNVKTKESVDLAYVGKNVLYFSRLIEKAAQSYLSRIITLPIYQNMTIRNWNTTTKLLALIEK